MRAIVVGAVESTRAALAAVAAVPGWAVDAVVTLPPELARRHADFVDLGPDAAAVGAGLIHAADGNAPPVRDRLRELAADCVLVVGWSQLCGRAFLDAAHGRVVGFHPAALPRLRGRAVIPWTILLDEKITGSTLFWIDEGTDTGPILAQRFLHVAPDETAGSLYARHLAALAEMIAEALPQIAQGTAPRVTQDERYASWCARRTAEDGRIDWAGSAAEVWRLVRAVGRPYPGAHGVIDGRRLTIWRAAPAARHGIRELAAASGQIVAREASRFAVRCGDGQDLLVEEFAWQDGAAAAAPRLHARFERA